MSNKVEEILKCFLEEHPNTVHTNEDLGECCGIAKQYVSYYISILRSSPHQLRIETVRGRGYRLIDETKPEVVNIGNLYAHCEKLAGLLQQSVPATLVDLFGAGTMTAVLKTNAADEITAKIKKSLEWFTEDDDGS